ncbi:MAG: FIVAR domain-containing protein [Propionibacteriaceae bacterium]|nr:FIVAR domain-containing protein [Propionibacteriaceae bacterium]
MTLPEGTVTWQELLVDGDDVERGEDGTPYNTFGGFGAVSCNNTSNLLIDYKEESPEAYWAIMNALFNPDSGAGLRHIKVEMGADSNSSSGAEPATKRTQDEPANVLRGAGFWFIADALSINPEIEIEALRWGEPSWTGNDYAKRYQWYKETIDAAYDVFGVEFDWMSPSQNEIGGGSTSQSAYTAELRWVVQFAKWLERDATAPDARYDYNKIQIVAMDSYRSGAAAAAAVLANAEALQYVDAFGYHYDIEGAAAITTLNKQYGMPIIDSEAVAPMIDPQYRLTVDPTRGGIGGTVGAVDIAERFIAAYRWTGGNAASDANPAHMTTFLFQPAISAMYEGAQYLPKHLMRASDPWSGYWEGDVGLVAVRHYQQFMDKGWEYIESATWADGTKGDGGVNVDTATTAVMTTRTPAADPGPVEFSQVYPNNTSKQRYYEVKVARLGETGRPLHAWQTVGPQAGQSYDANYFQKIGYFAPVDQEEIDGVIWDVYRIDVKPWSILTVSTLPDGLNGSTESYQPGDFAPSAADTPLALPYSDDFEYADYPTVQVAGQDMTYIERRGGSPRYTADQNGAFEVVDSGQAEHGFVLRQQNTAVTRGYAWNVWSGGSQNSLVTTEPTTVLGEQEWANYKVSADFKHDLVVLNSNLANYASLGLRQTYARGGDQASYAIRVYSDGRWQLRRYDSPVASGTVFMFDPSQWHDFAISADENVITAWVDGQQLAQYTDTAAGPTMAGRLALGSGYYNTLFDNLEVTPITDAAWEATKIDDADARITYSAFTWEQAGYAHYNRTRHLVSNGRSFSFAFDGTGINLTGSTSASQLSVSVDGGAAQTVQIAQVGDRRTSYWLRGLSDGPHTFSATVTQGTFTLDSVEILHGGATVAPPDVPDAERPVTVTETLPRYAVLVDGTLELPAQVQATSAAGGAIAADVTWQIPAGAFATAWAQVAVEGSFVNNPTLKVLAQVEVVPPGAVYFLDANAPAVGADAVAYPAVAALLAGAGTPLLNTVADQNWSTGADWGCETTSAKGRLNEQPYDKTRETGRYGDNMVCRFTLPAGDWVLTSAHTEWWTVGSGKTRAADVKVSDGVSETALGSYSFPNGSIGQSKVLSGQFSLSQPTTIVYTNVKTSTESPALSWIGIAALATSSPTVDRSVLAGLLEQAQNSPAIAYTAESWQSLRQVALSAKAVHDDPAATQGQIDQAATVLGQALDQLVEVAYQTLPDYRIAAYVGQAPQLPGTIALRTISGQTEEIPVVWQSVDPAAFATPYSAVSLTGQAGLIPVTLVVEVVPEDLVYFIDANAFPGSHTDGYGADSPAWLAVESLLGEQLINQTPDQFFPDPDPGQSFGLSSTRGSTNGNTNPKTPAGGLYDKYCTTGWYVAGSASTYRNSTADYKIWLPAGDWTLTAGFCEWWNGRNIRPSVTAENVTSTGPDVSVQGIGAKGSSDISFSLVEPGYATFKVLMVPGGNQLPVLSWVAVSATVDRAGLAAAMAAAEALDEQLHTADSWEPLAQALASAQALLDDPGAGKDQVAAAIAQLTEAIGGLVDARQPLSELVDQLSGLTPTTYTFAPWQTFALALAQAWAVLDGEPVTRDVVAAQIEQLNAAQAGLVLRVTVQPPVLSVASGQVVDGLLRGQVGDTVSLSVTVDPVEADLTYLWFRGTSVIGAATGQSSYVLQPADANAIIQVKVIASLPQGETVTKYSNWVTVGQYLTVTELSLSGSGQIGSPLTVTAAATPDGVTVAYDWFRGVSYIGQAKDATSYTAQAADAGQAIKVKVTFSKGSWTLVRYTDPVLIEDLIKVTATPTLSGAAEIGSTLTAQIGFTPAEAEARYDWYRVNDQGTAVFIVTGPATYLVRAADATHTIKVKVTLSAEGMDPVVRYSLASDQVPGQPAPAVNSVVLAQNGGVAQATVDLTLPPGASVRYDWYRGTTYLNGVTGLSYAVQAQDVGADLKVKVTVSAPDFASVVRYSLPLRVVSPGH